MTQCSPSTPVGTCRRGLHPQPQGSPGGASHYLDRADPNRTEGTARARLGATPTDRPRRVDILTCPRRLVGATGQGPTKCGYSPPERPCAGQLLAPQRSVGTFTWPPAVLGGPVRYGVGCPHRAACRGGASSGLQRAPAGSSGSPAPGRPRSLQPGSSAQPNRAPARGGDAARPPASVLGRRGGEAPQSGPSGNRPARKSPQPQVSEDGTLT
jgi:hypothetical protein